MTRSTINNVGVTMFTVADQDAALAFYTEKLGWEVRADVAFGAGDRWLEVAPAGSAARVALNPPMGGEPGGGAIGVETPDVRAEFAHLSAVDGVTVVQPLLEVEGAPPMFAIADPDGNHMWVVHTPPPA